MTRIRLILATACALSVPAAAASARQPAALRTLATFSGDSIQDFGVSPNGTFVLVSTKNALRMYDVAHQTSRELVKGHAEALTWATQGDRIAWTQGTSAANVNVWSMPIDARTGKPRGAAQRITPGRSIGAAFSADGRWIAYTSVDSTNGKRMQDAVGISMVPATGGPERVIAARYPSEGAAWSADGKSLYVNGEAKTPAGWGIVKIRISDGARELLSTPPGELLVGMTADRRHLITSSHGKGNPVLAGDRATITDTAGRVLGRVPLPPGPAFGWPGALGDSAIVWVTTSDRAGALEIAPLAGGDARRLPVQGESNTMPLWSPDGKRIAFLVPTTGRTALGVMNADGTGARIYREVNVIADFLGMLWSPDSRSLAFRRADTPGMSSLDVGSGTIRSVADDPIGGWQWRSDGQALLVRSRRVPGAGIDEITLNGQRRMLLDWPPPGRPLDWAFIGDTSIFRFTMLDTAAFLQSLGPSPARRFATVPAGSILTRPALSRDSRQVVMFKVRQNGNASSDTQLAVFTLATGALRVIDLPFAWRTGGTVANPATFLPGDSAVLVFGKRPNEASVKLFRVPLFGGAPTVVADVGTPGEGMLQASLSPDGKSVVYSVRRASVTRSLVLLDLRSALANASRSPQR